MPPEMVEPERETPGKHGERLEHADGHRAPKRQRLGLLDRV